MRARSSLLAVLVLVLGAAACAGSAEHANDAPRRGADGGVVFVPLPTTVTGGGDEQQQQAGDDGGAVSAEDDAALPGAGEADAGIGATGSPAAASAAAQASADRATDPALNVGATARRQ